MKKIIGFSAAILILSATLTFSQGVGSQGVTDARSLGMAKTFTTSTFGLYAVGKNPANLFDDSLKSVEFAVPLPIPNIAASVGSNFMTIDNYNYYFGTKVTNPLDGSVTGRILTAADKENLKEIFKDGGTVVSDVSVQLLSISVRPSRNFGTIAFSVSDRVSSITTFPNRLVELALDGNTPKQVYNFNDTQFKASWLRKYSLTFSRSFNFLPKVFKSFNLGVSLNIVHGFAYAALDRINTELSTGDANVIAGKSDMIAYSAFASEFNVHYDFDKLPKNDFSFAPFPTPAGSGIGLDFGISTKLSNVFSVGFSVTDIGNIKWDKNVAQFSSNKDFSIDDITDKDQLDTLINRITGKDNGKFIGSITTQMATALHLGASYIVTPKLLLALDYHQGFNDEPGNSKKARFSLGIDWHNLGVFNLRSGFSVGGFEKFNWGLGFGLDFGILEMNFGSPDFQYAFSPSTAKRITFAVDSKWKF
jgi:hypothetical protein